MRGLLLPGFWCRIDDRHLNFRDLVLDAAAVLRLVLSFAHCRIAGLRTFGARTGDFFRRLLQLIAVCPEPGGDSGQVRAVSLYFGLLGLVRVLFGWIEPAVAGWIESERSGCAYLAAVMLDRRIAYNRVLMARQMSAQL